MSAVFSSFVGHSARGFREIEASKICINLIKLFISNIRDFFEKEKLFT